MATYRLPFGYMEWPDEPPVEPESSHFDAESNATARVLLRLPATLKRKIEASAALEGLSPDAWVEHVLYRSVDPRLDGA